MSDSRDGEAGFFGIPEEIKLTGIAFGVALITGWLLAAGLKLRASGQFYSLRQASDYFPGGSFGFDVVTSIPLLHLYLVLAAGGAALLLYLLHRHCGRKVLWLIVGLVVLYLLAFEGSGVHYSLKNLSIRLPGNLYPISGVPAQWVFLLYGGYLWFLLAAATIVFFRPKSAWPNRGDYRWLIAVCASTLAAFIFLASYHPGSPPEYNWRGIFISELITPLRLLMLVAVFTSGTVAVLEVARDGDTNRKTLLTALGLITLLTLIHPISAHLPEHYKVRVHQLEPPPRARSVEVGVSSYSAPDNFRFRRLRTGTLTSERLRRHLTKQVDGLPIGQHLSIQELNLSLVSINSPLTSFYPVFALADEHAVPGHRHPGLGVAAWALRNEHLSRSQLKEIRAAFRTHPVALSRELRLLEKLIAVQDRQAARQVMTRLNRNLESTYPPLGVFGLVPALRDRLNLHDANAKRLKVLREELDSLSATEPGPRSLTLDVKDNHGDPVQGVPVVVREAFRITVKQTDDAPWERGTFKAEAEYLPRLARAAYHSYRNAKLTDSEGTATFRGLFPARYEVSVAAGFPGSNSGKYQFATLDSPLPGRLPSGETQVEITLQDPGYYRVTQPRPDKYELKLTPPGSGTLLVESLTASSDVPSERLHLQNPSQEKLELLYTQKRRIRPEEIVFFNQNADGKPTRFWVWQGVKRGGSPQGKQQTGVGSSN